MDSVTNIIEDLSAVLEVEITEGRAHARLTPEALAFLSPHPREKPAAAAGRSRTETRGGTAAGEAGSPVKQRAANTTAPARSAATVGTELKTGTLEFVAARIAECEKCPLHATRNKTVPGEGPLGPDIMFVGEGPGAGEDAQGIPFVGRAGKLLTDMIEAMGYTREEVFIANVVKCRPPDNRNPSRDEMDQCLPYLREQIKIVRPKTIVALGTVAAQGLLDSDAKISRLRTEWHAFEGIPLKPTFHPSYLLRNPAAKREAWVDLREVLRHLGRTPPQRKKASEQ